MVHAAAALAACFVGAALVSWLLTACALRYAQRASLLDHPVARSSHSMPTPRGGGVGIAATVLISSAVLWGYDYLDSRFAVSLVVGGLLIAGVGWIDDHRSVPAGVRAAVHVAAGVVLLSAFGWPSSIHFGFGELSLGLFGQVFYLLLIVWLINLFNFMDGIDGIAASQALVVGAIGSILMAVDMHPGVATLSVIVAGSSLGFLRWNWPPARLFMGDVGSGFLGFVFACIAIASDNNGSLPVLVWILLLSVFIFDATVTLLRRVAQRERWHEAHRSHAYQRLVIAGRSHLFVTGWSIALTLLAGILSAVASRWQALILLLLAVQLSLLAILYLKVERLTPMSKEPQN